MTGVARTCGELKIIFELVLPGSRGSLGGLPPPDRERGSWYFQRYISHLPTAGEFVLFNRS
ncbi:MAG: hypothetical protein J4A00_08820 [Gammaproteobacteria bacterium]|nr:hypothetical protein [Gammaproteobacteria bacterium]